MMAPKGEKAQLASGPEKKGQVSGIEFIPFLVTVGFTAGVAVVIFASQVRALFGLALEHEPGVLAQKIPALWARGRTSPPQPSASLPVPSRSSSDSGVNWRGKLTP
jgi:hypothetical protein